MESVEAIWQREKSKLNMQRVAEMDCGKGDTGRKANARKMKNRKLKLRQIA